MQDVEHPQAQTRSFAIQTEVYSGPLDLLIDLIEKRKLLVNDISIATVTDDYMRYVAMIEQSSIRETSQFVVLASTLLLIKSKSLLPVFDLSESEEESVENLEARLREYQIYRTAGRTLEGLFGAHVSYERTFVRDETPLFVTDRRTEVSALREALCDVIARLPQKAAKPKVEVRKVVSLEEMIDRLRARIEQQMSLKFNEFTGHSGERSVVIVGFLAVLEMVKQGNVLVRQSSRYTDIEIERESGTVPTYM